MRYLNYYIHDGHLQTGRELSRPQRDALDAVEQSLDDSELFVQFRLEPGQMLWSNNHWILHNRNAFIDHEDPDLRRRYVRLWLSSFAT